MRSTFPIYVSRFEITDHRYGEKSNIFNATLLYISNNFYRNWEDVLSFLFLSLPSWDAVEITAVSVSLGWQNVAMPSKIEAIMRQKRDLRTADA